MVTTLATRGSEGVAVIHDRNPLFVQLSDGSIRNAYTLRIVNKQPMPRRFALSVDGVPEAKLEVTGAVSTVEDGRPVVEVGPDQTFELRVLVSTHAKLPAEASLGVTFHIIDVASGESSSAPDHFKGP